MRGSTGISEFAQLLRGSAHKAVATADRIPLVNAGTMQADGSLAVDGFRHPFAPGEFLTLRQNLLPDPMTVTSATAVGDHGTHTHPVVRPAELLPQPEYPEGTRVLVVWLFGRTTPVILGALQ